jgi:hypothetical protein
MGTLLGELIETANVLLPGPTQQWTGRVFRYLGRRGQAS